MNQSRSALLPHYQWNLLQANLDWVSHSQTKDKRNEPNSKYSPHYTADWVQQGKVRMSMGSRFKVIEAQTGEWIFRQPGKNVSFTAYPGTTWTTIGFSLRWTGAVRLLRPPKELFWKTNPLPELETKLTRLRDMVHRELGKEGSYEMLLTETDMSTHFLYASLFYDWLMTWEQTMRNMGYGWYQVKETDEKIVHAVRYLEELSLDQPIRVSNMAQSLGISPRHLSRLFYKEYGLAPKAYRMQLKLKQALQELQTTNDEIKEIATRLGCNPVWFGVWIRKETGRTPSQIRSGQ